MKNIIKFRRTKLWNRTWTKPKTAIGSDDSFILNYFFWHSNSNLFILAQTFAFRLCVTLCQSLWILNFCRKLTTNLLNRRFVLWKMGAGLASPLQHIVVTFFCLRTGIIYTYTCILYSAEYSPWINFLGAFFRPNGTLGFMEVKKCGGRIAGRHICIWCHTCNYAAVMSKVCSNLSDLLWLLPSRPLSTTPRNRHSKPEAAETTSWAMESTNL